MSVWLGNTDNKPLTVGRGGAQRIPVYMVDQVMASATDLYKSPKIKLADDYWKRPTGIQVINGDLYPSYFNKASAPANAPVVFDKECRRKKLQLYAQNSPKETINVLKVTDPVTKQDTYTSPDGYDANADDNSHLCSDTKPSVTVTVSGNTASGELHRRHIFHPRRSPS